MDIKQIMSFVKIEHTLFSLPFIVIGFIIAADQFYPADEFPYLDLVWILVASGGVGRCASDPGPPYDAGSQLTMDGMAGV